MSYLQLLTVKSFHKLNPSWTIVIHTPDSKGVTKDTYIPEYRGEDFWPECKSLSNVIVKKENMAKLGIPNDIHDILRSDILRYVLLYQQGGVWSDFDVIWLTPMSFFNNIRGEGDMSKSKTIVCMRDTVSSWHNISILMSEPKHPFYFGLIQKCLLKLSNGTRVGLDHQEFGTRMLNEMFPTLNSIQSKYSDIIGLPYDVFYPYKINNIEQLWEHIDLSPIKENVMCVHWWNGHVLSKKFVNNPKKECSMTRILKGIGFDYV